MTSMQIPGTQEPQRQQPYAEPEPPENTPPQEGAQATAPEHTPPSTPAEASQEPQEPVQAPKRTSLPPDFEEKMMRLVKARADALEQTRFDDRGRVVKEGIADPDERLLAAGRSLAKFYRYPEFKEGLRAYLDGGEMPKDWVPARTPTKSIETWQLERQMLANREKNPVLSAAHDYVIGPVGEIVPAFAQVFADTYVGLVNFLPGEPMKSPDVKAALHAAIGGGTVEDARARINALNATSGTGSGALRFAGELGGQLPAYLVGGGAGAAVKGATAVTKGNALLQGAKALALAPGTIMKAGGAVGSRIGAKVGGKVAGEAGAAVGKAVGHASGGFAALGGVTESENRLEGLGLGAASGAAVGAFSELGKAALRGMFRHAYQALGSDEKQAMDALKKWARDNGVHMRAGDTQDGYVRSLTNAFVDAGMPGVKGIAVKKLLGYAVQGGIDSVGFSTIDYEFWKEHGEAVFSGDAEALKELGAKLAGGALALGAFHVPLKDIPARQRRSQIEPQGEAPKPMEPSPASPASPGDVSDGKSPAVGGSLEAGITTTMPPEAQPRTQTPERNRQQVLEKLRTDIQRRLTPLEALGWRDVEAAQDQAAVDRMTGEGGSQPQGRVVELPGTPHSYTVTGDTATANPSLAKVVGTKEPLPVATMEGMLEHASLQAALQSKLLPGTEISAHRGIKAVGTNGEKDGVMRTVSPDGTVLESPLQPDAKWKPAETVPQRGKDALEPDQQAVVAALGDVLTGATDMPRADRDMLASVRNVLDTVAARNDQSVAETLQALPKLIEAMGNAPTPEQASLAIKAVAESLTVKLPEQAIRDMQRVQTEAIQKAAMSELREPSLRELWEEYDSEGKVGGRDATIDDLADAVRDLPNVPEKVMEAIERYEEAVREDREEHGMRSGLPEDAGEALEAAIRASVSDGAQKSAARVAHEKAAASLEAIGPEPRKPSSLAKAFGRRGPTPEQEATHKREVAAYQSWRRKYLRLKKAEVEASNQLFAEERSGDAKPESRAGESGMLDVGAAAESAAKTSKSVGEVVGGAAEAVFRDQITSTERRGGDPELAAGMRRAASESRTSIGEVTNILSEAEVTIRENREALMQTVEVAGASKPRWDALLHGEVQPANASEAQVAEVLNRALLRLWEIEQQSGAFLSKPGPEGSTIWFERSTDRTQSKLPRTWAEGRHEVYEDPAARQRWFDLLAELNPLQIREKGKLRQRTGADFEADYQADVKATKIKNAERDSSFEHIRTLQNVPYEFEGRQMLERDPFEVFRRVITEQASRAAVIKEFGQEGVPDEQQQAARTRLGLNPEAKGVSDALQRWFKTLPKSDPEALTQATATMTRLQGKEPAPLGRLGDKARRVQGVRRAAMTMLSGLRDIPSMFTEGANWTSVTKMAKVVDDVLRHYPAERKRAERLGTLINEIGNLNLHEATDPINKAADWLGEFGNVPGIKLIAPRATERLRTVMMSKVADVVLKDWAAGEGRAGARQLLKELDFNEADAAALVEGTASTRLQNQFRHQLVQRAMSRGRSAERSRFSASPMVQAWVDFTGYASKRAYGLAREAKTAMETFKPGSDATPAEKWAITKRLTTRITGLVAGGMLGDLLYYIVADGIEGKNGLNHYVRDLLTYPSQTITKGAVSGVLAGPLAILFRAATQSPDDAARLTVPTGLAQAFFRAGHDGTTSRGFIETVFDYVAATGVVPQPSRLKALAGYVSGAALGENTEFRDDAKLVSQFKQQEGVPVTKSPRDKQPEFYSALAQIRDFIDKADMSLSPEAAAKQVRQQADAAIRQALGLQPEENVAAAVRAMQHAENVDRQRLMDYVRDEKRFERMMMHDQMVSELAEAIGREQGTNPTPFEERLAGAAKIAAGKARNAWNKLASDTVEDAAVARNHGQPLGTALRDLANRMSLHPESVLVDDTLGDADKKMWARMSTQNQRQRFLEGVFRERMSAAAERLREAARMRR